MVTIVFIYSMEKGWQKIILEKVTLIQNNLGNSLHLALGKLKSSPIGLYYLAAVIVGLGLARVVDASIVTYISIGKEVEKTSKIKKRPSRSISSSANVDSLQIIGGALFSPAPVEEEAIEEEKEVTQFDYTVLGTIDGHPSFASVVVNQLGGEELGTREYSIGGKIGYDRVVWIGREYIVIRRDGEKIKIKVGENALAVPQASVQEQGSSKTGKRVKKSVSKQDALKILNGNPAAIYKGASFGPVLDKGNITGYKIFRVKPSHFFYKLGARGGDIIRKVNGFELNDTERMFELWKSMKTASNVSIDLERKGKNVTYDLKLVN